MPKKLPKLYEEGYRHAISDAEGAVRATIRRLDSNKRSALAVDRRALDYQTSALAPLADYIAKMKPNADDRDDLLAQEAREQSR